MKSVLQKFFGDNSDQAWRWFGEHDPYYGVLARTEHRKDNLTADRLQSFFESGQAHVDRVCDIVSRHLGSMGARRCLDFGSGVGRLVLPFARRFERVVGVDVSLPMIEEAQRNCRRLGVTNVAFVQSLDEVQEQFDLVHTYIVLQHVPLSKGMKIIDRLVDLITMGGIGFIHFTIGRQAGMMRDVATFARKNIKPLHWMLNMREEKRAFEAYMQSNEYSLNALAARLYSRQIRQMWIEIENHGGPFSVCTAFRSPSP
jgi:2-polyprenyl-3-methyl-5-hydroxy-6-metoxy-1,4-benzoquinol methylase